MSFNQSNTMNGNNDVLLPPILYKQNDIVIIKEDGVEKKRHIFGKEPMLREKNYGVIVVYDWLYQVDYGLMYEHEGLVKQSEIVRIA